MLSVGLVGLPNAGKSTLFNLFTKKSVPAENYPFCTIDPHQGLVKVPDQRIPVLAKISKSIKEVYTAIEFTDIAGLVKNAHQGEGLGNQFLSHIHQVDLILLTIRCFENSDIIHVENRVNPIEDEEILMIELTLHDQQKVENLLVKIQKESRRDPLAKQKIEICEQILTQLSRIQPARNVVLAKDTDPEIIKWRTKELCLLTDKPMLKLANITYNGQNYPLPGADFEIDVLLESQLIDLSKQERLELGLTAETGLDKLVTACYQKLDLATFLTTGPSETRAWTFKKGMTAPECAGKIHSDFEKKFIKVEVVKYTDFVQNNGWVKAREMGCVKTLGRDYLMEDGDIVEFKINH